MKANITEDMKKISQQISKKPLVNPSCSSIHTSLLDTGSVLWVFSIVRSFSLSGFLVNLRVAMKYSFVLAVAPHAFTNKNRLIQEETCLQVIDLSKRGSKLHYYRKFIHRRDFHQWFLDNWRWNASPPAHG
jgi:hypothetical protein